MKKWTYLVAACMLAGATPVFTGCVDNDEPAGIEQLRGAKAELLRAKAAVENAKAKIIAAYEGYVAAEVREKEAMALQAELAAESIRLQNELQEIENQEAQKEMEQRLQQIQNEMDLANEEFKANMIKKQQLTAEAERAYEVLQQQIAIAKAIGSDKEKVTLESLELEIDKAYDALYKTQYIEVETGQQVVEMDGDLYDEEGKKIGYLEGNAIISDYKIVEEASLDDRLFEASQDLQVAINNKAKGYDTGTEGEIIGDTEYWPDALLAIMKQAEAKVAAETAALEKLQEAQTWDVESTDWRAQIDELDKEVDALKLQYDQKNLAIKNAEGNADYIKAWQDAYGVFNEPPKEFYVNPNDEEIGGVRITLGGLTVGINEGDLQPVKDGALQTLQRAYKEVEDKKEETELKYSAFTLDKSVAISKKVAEILSLDTELTSQGIEEYADIFAYEEGTYKWVKADEENAGEFIAADSTDIEELKGLRTIFNNKFDKWIEKIEEEAPGITENEGAEANARLEALKEKKEDAYEAYQTAMEKANTVRSIVDESKNYTEISTTAIKTAVDAYKAAYTSLENAIKTWNEKVSAEYKAASDKKRAEFTMDLKKTAAYSLTGEDAIAGFDPTVLQQYINNNESQTGKPVTDEAFTTFVNLSCQANGTTTAAQVQTSVWNAINEYVAEKADEDWLKEIPAGETKSRSELMAAAGKAGVTKYRNGDTGKAEWKKVTDDATGVQNAYKGYENVKGLEGAVEDFKTLAKSYAQKTTISTKALAGAVNDKGEVTADVVAVNAASWYTTDNADKGTVKIQNSNITDAEYAAAIKVEFDKNWENEKVKTVSYTYTEGNSTINKNNVPLNALEAANWDAYGQPEDYRWYVEPSREEFDEICKNQESAGAKYWVAYDEYQKRVDIIAAEEDLKTLLTALQNGRAALVAEAEAAYKENFAKLDEACLAAEEDYLAAVKALDDKATELFGDLEADVAALKAEIDALADVHGELMCLAWNYLGITWPEDAFTNGDYEDLYTTPANMYDPDTFAQELAEAIAQQEYWVAKAKQDYTSAEIDYNTATATEGVYDGVAYFTNKKEQVQEEWDIANRRYQKAIEDLQKAMEILANSAE